MLSLAVTGIAAGLAGVCVVVFGAGPHGLVRALQLTARWSYLLFWIAYAGAAWTAITGRFASVTRHGRAFGLAYAAAHLVHLGLVLWLYQIATAPLLSPALWVFFSIALLWTYLLTLISLPAVAKRLGPTACRATRGIGMEYIAFAFLWDFLTVPKTLFAACAYIPFAALGVTGTAMRLTIFWTLWRRAASVPGFPTRRYHDEGSMADAARSTVAPAIVRWRGGSRD